jgi:hypothetical protein
MLLELNAAQYLLLVWFIFSCFSFAVLCAPNLDKGVSSLSLASPPLMLPSEDVEGKTVRWRKIVPGLTISGGHSGSLPMNTLWTEPGAVLGQVLGVVV